MESNPRQKPKIAPKKRSVLCASVDNNDPRLEDTKRRSFLPFVVIGLVVSAVVIVIAVIIAINVAHPIPDNYFVSDDTKLVLSFNSDMANFENSEYEPELTHIVYYYSGDKITDIKLFYVYENEAEAKDAYAHISLGDFASRKSLNGRYIILSAKSDEIDKASLEDIRSLTNLREAAN